MVLSPTSSEAEPQGFRPRVLVVDDDRDFCHMVGARLGPRFDVALAHDGEEALRQARRERPDLILLDIMLPRLSGRSLRWQFRQIPFFRGVPVVFCSALVPHELEADTPYLLKPFGMEQLEGVLARALHDGSDLLGDPARAEAALGPSVPVDLTASLTLPSAAPRGGRLRQLYAWGAVLETREQPPAGTTGSLAIADAEGITALPCRIIGPAPQSRLGLRFLFSEPGLEEDYSRLLSRHGAVFS